MEIGSSDTLTHHGMSTAHVAALPDAGARRPAHCKAGRTSVVQAAQGADGTPPKPAFAGEL